MPTNPQHTPTIIQPSTSQPPKKQRSRRPKRKDTEIPQSSVPSDNVADEAVNEEVDDSLVKATTTATGLDAEQDSGVNTPRRDEDSLKLKELMKLSRIESSEDEVSTHFDADTDIFGVHDLVGDEVVVESEVAVKAASTIPVSAATTTTTIITNDEITLAKALAKLKSAKLPTTIAATIVTTASTRPKAKGLVIHEEEQATTPTVSSQQPSQDLPLSYKLKKKKKKKKKKGLPEKNLNKLKKPTLFHGIMEDLETLGKLVKAKHRSTRPKEGYERVLWGDLKTMMQHMHIHMLVEKRYPLTPATITDMLNKKLQWEDVKIKRLHDDLEVTAAKVCVTAAKLNLVLIRIFMIRLHALHRRSAGTNALVVLRDTRWEDSRQIIGTMEVDLSAGKHLIYMFPDMVQSIDDFHNHVEVAIQTHGYDTWQGGESNLLVTMAMIGRLSNTSYMRFQYSVDNVVDHLTTTSITTIPGERRSVEELEGMSWNLKPSEQTMFERYRRAPQPARYLVDQHDREILGDDHLDEDEEHFIGICLQDPQIQHIPCDICFCEDCINEARILEEEPLNKAKRSNKPKRSKQRSWEKWSTLGEPSGKWDYYVRYDTPTNTVPIEEIAATGWGDEFLDSEATPGKVTILDQKDDWDDDERSEGKILVLQEQFSQNQQDFLDEYLPQWDDQFAIQQHKSEMEWENPFAAKRGEDHTVLHLSKNEEKDDDLPYPKFRKFKQLAAQIINKHEEHAFPTAADDSKSSTSYQPPTDAIIGPAVYPPAR
ncbi:hypothetical protein Tco_0886948 [Tanacetum coccineum]